ncbi:MAG: mevalonate kinase [Armatimonadota bacterium]
MIISYRVPARVGLLGNPSDGFGGKTISCCVAEYAAKVRLWESAEVTLLPHRVHDPMVFESLADMHHLATRNGYYGGLRLLWATCKSFFDHCRHAGIALPQRNFTLEYDTTIPRQVGLAGSSAIVTGALKCLTDFYEVNEEQLPKAMQPNLVLQAETDELGIAAGLQDRVVQVYGGLVYMDFAPILMAAQGHGFYKPMDMSLLPPLYMAITRNPSDSSRVHSPVRRRFDRGEAVVVDAMRKFAALAQEGYAVLWSRDYEALAVLMDENFDLRRAIYGDEALGKQNLEMVAIARKHGLPAKLAGSGGVIVGFCEDDAQLARAQGEFEQRGYLCTKATPTHAPAAEVTTRTMQPHRAVQEPRATDAMSWTRATGQ